MQHSDEIQKYQDVEFCARRESKRIWLNRRGALQRGAADSRIRNARGALVIVFALVSMTFCGSSWSQVELPYGPTMVELTKLPPECGPKLGLGPNVQAKNAAYGARYGEAVWLHYHHYCFALNFMNRQALVYGNKPARRYDLQSAINNFNYLIAHWPANAPQRMQAIQLKRLAEMQLKSIK